jgi:hypothetical protein
MSTNFETALKTYLDIPLCHRSKSLDQVKDAAVTFEDRLKLYGVINDEVHQTYTLEEDDDFLGQGCDSVRNTILPWVMEAAGNKTQGRKVIGLTNDRTTDLKAKLETKLASLPD